VVCRSNDGVAHGTSIRQEFGIPSDAPIVGAICRLNPIKGVNYLVEAAGLLRDRFPEARFIVLGDGEIKPELTRRFKELGLESRAILTGFRTDTGRFLREFDVSVLPSLTEGLSNTVMESMAAGVPVVATRVGGTPEIVVDGVTGFLVEPRDVSGLANSIATLIEDRQFARRMGDAGRRHILEQFSIERAVGKLEDLYSGLLSPHGKQAA
jgi:glycosyltransferase involved in cell wall biosynthesis